MGRRHEEAQRGTALLHYQCGTEQAQNQRCDEPRTI